MGIGVFPGVQCSVLESDNSPTHSVEGKNEWNVYSFFLLFNLKYNNPEKLSDSKEIMLIIKYSNFVFKYSIGTRGLQL